MPNETDTRSASAGSRGAKNPQSFTGAVHLRAVDPVRDAELIFAWSRRAHVREYWELGEGLNGVRAYLREKNASGYLRPSLIEIEGVAAGYAELYDYNRDPVALVFPGRPNSGGWHIFLGEERFIGTGHAVHVGRAILRELFARVGCRTVYCEPDVRNLRMHRFVAKLGHREVGRVHLPDKTALIMQCDREDFDATLIALEASRETNDQLYSGRSL
ncbi:MAG: GNAT family N-acetyltransferase [Leptospirales bacterium]|jgi:RimJ/RimL family protein N-acetyltransferase